MTTFAYNSSLNGATAVTATRTSVTLQFTDESGAAVAGQTLSLSNYWLNTAVLPSGTGLTDTLITTSGNDLVLWDDKTETTTSDQFASNRYGAKNSSATAAIETFSLGAGNDVFAFNYSSVSTGTGYTFDVVVDAGTGNDIIWSSAGNDDLYGGAGIDKIYGGAGNDVLAGELAVDDNAIVAGGATSNADTLYGGSGNDTIWGDSVGDLNGEAGGGNDKLFGGSGTDTIYGGADSDTVQGGAGNDFLYGGDGVDFLDLSDATFGVNFNLAALGLTISIGGSNDVVVGFEGVIATAFADIIDGDSLANILYGAGGNDTFWTGAGEDTAFGGDGDDTLWMADGDDLAYGDAGNDDLFGKNQADTLYGGGGNDLVTGNWADNSTYLQDGADALYGDAGDDSLYGGDQGDTMFGGTGADILRGDVAQNGGAPITAGNDVAYGGTGADTLFGDAGNDTLYGGTEANVTDTYIGGAGDDYLHFEGDSTFTGSTSRVALWDGTASSTLSVSAGSSTYFYSRDLIYGDDVGQAGAAAAGDDTIQIDRSRGMGGVVALWSEEIVVNGAVIASPTATDRIWGVEVILGTNFNDIVALNHKGNSSTYDSNTTIVGYEGIDMLFDGTGSSLIIGDGTVSGTTTSIDIIAGGAGADVIWGDNQNGIDGVAGGADTLWGGSGADTMYGGGGDDTMFGGATDNTDDGGADTMRGGDGNDWIQDYNNAGLVHGGLGDDEITLNFTSGRTTIYGGGGNDDGYVSGVYDSSTVDMGDGNDYLVELGSGGNQIDTVWGGNGDDIISIFAGNDTAWGGGGVDVMWSGAGTDTMYGGDGNDHLYGGEFGNTTDHNYIYGGIGEDCVYVSRDDGTDHYYGGADGRNDEIVMFGRFALTTETAVGGWFSANTGVSENNGGNVNFGQRLGSDADSDITITYNGTTATMINDQTGATIIFSTNDVQAITLWNSDATGLQHFEEVFEWNATQNAYTFDHWA